MKTHSRLMLLTAALTLLLALASPSAEAVRIGENGEGQVLLFPLFSVEASNETELTVRNTSDVGKALRIIAKDPLLGRPLLTVNVYLKPLDSWTGRLVQNSDRALEPRLVSNDESCTFPAIPGDGLAATARFLGPTFNDRVGDRLQSGFLEVYEMGQMDSTLAGDCDAITRRWESGAWESMQLTALRNDGITPPAGGLTGLVAIKSVDSGRSFQLEPVVLDRFTTEALHVHPDWPVRPSLMDVRPAIAEVPSILRLNSLEIRTLVPQSFSQTPIHAVDALLMTTGVSAAYYSDEPGLSFSTILLTMPTRPYHSDRQGYYLRGRERVVAPFQTGTPRRAPDPTGADVLQGGAVDSTGRRFELFQSPGAMECDATESTVNGIALTNRLNFSRVCELGEAEIFLPDGSTRGEVTLQFSGQLVSDEGDVFSGLPVIGYLFQDTVGGSITGANPVFARPVQRQTEE
ncbi:MAG: hypothetical protein QNJ40_04600 [Xanthomonadales bacterium]|nr:hypothetical protein [Xanthomonadales bacterium]